MKKKTITSVITGIAGFLGFYMADLLPARRHKVVGIDNLVTGSVDNDFASRRQPMNAHFLISLLALATACLANSAVASDQSLPHLETRNGTRQLIVDGKPFLILGGELHNSSSASRAYMNPIWPQLAKANLNTVLAAVSWELIEPKEGQFDFPSVDHLIEDARQYHLRLILLWFGSWKNGGTSYQPLWVKTDPTRFPLVQDRTGITLSTLSTFGEATCKADARAFAALMRHLRKVDSKEHTVLMVQVENEVGVMGDSRDCSPAANEAFAQPVPSSLLDYLVKHKETLAPELREVWAGNGGKTSGSWEQVFGPGRPTPVAKLSDLSDQEREEIFQKWSWAADEIFMAWRYSTYINRVAAAGKAQYNLPMFCNAWLRQRHCPRPGDFPSGGPIPQVNDVWRWGAPNIDFLSPDIYRAEFDKTCEQYTRNGNPLFIPETHTGPLVVSNALTTILRFNAMGFCPFAIDSAVDQNAPQMATLAQTYALLQYLSPVLLENQNKGGMVRLDTASSGQEVKLGDYSIKISPLASDKNSTNSAVETNLPPLRLIINSGPGEYYFVGGTIKVRFTPSEPDSGKVLMGSFDESIYRERRWYPGRRLNGDESSNDSRWPDMKSFGIYRYTVYRQK